MRFALLAILAAGCTRSNPQLGGTLFDLYVAPIGDLAGADLSTVTFDFAVANPDLVVTPVDLGMRDLAARDLTVAAGDLSASAGCVRINEVMLGSLGKAGDEFVEITNVCDRQIRIDNWTLRYRSLLNNGGAANLDTPLVNFGVFAVDPHAYALFAGNMFVGAKDGGLATGLSAEGGGVALVDDGNLFVDSVAYGPVVLDHNYIEGSPASLPAAGLSLARSPDGFDSDQNAKDFAVRVPTPRAANL